MIHRMNHSGPYQCVTLAKGLNGAYLVARMQGTAQVGTAEADSPHPARSCWRHRSACTAAGGCALHGYPLPATSPAGSDLLLPQAYWGTVLSLWHLCQKSQYRHTSVKKPAESCCRNRSACTAAAACALLCCPLQAASPAGWAPSRDRLTGMSSSPCNIFLLRFSASIL